MIFNACVKAKGKNTLNNYFDVLSRTVNISVHLMLALLWLWTDWHMLCFTRHLLGEVDIFVTVLLQIHSLSVCQKLSK